MNKTWAWLGAGALLLALAIAAALGAFGAGGTSPLSAAQQQALVRAHSPSLGSPQAKVVLVEFLDPACEACARFYPLVKNLLGQSDGKLRLVLRYAPFHKGSHEAVLALEAARMQGRFWPVLEAVMQSQNEWVQNHQVQPDRLWAVLARTGLDLAKARADAQSPQLMAQLEQDMIDGKDLEVAKTPSFFVNGQPLTEFGYEPLQELIAQQTRKAYSQ